MGGKTTMAAVLHGAKDLRIEQRPQPPPGPGEVQVSILATTLCGSDAHYYTHGANGAFKVLHPYILGHEAGGRVVEVGEGVQGLEVGMMVALECGVMCGRCERCKEGRYNLCPEMEFKSSAKRNPHADGTLRQTMNHPASLVHVLPSDASPLKAALAEPLAVVLHAFHRINPAPGSSLLVYGAGAVGLLACALARTLGFSSVCTVDISQERVALAKENGWATDGAALPAGERPKTAEEGLKRSEETSVWVKERFEFKDGFDYTIECTGVEPCIQSSVFCTRAGGKLALVGMGTPVVTMPLAAAALREVDILGVFRYANCYPTAIRLLAQKEGPLSNIDKIVTHQIPLNEAARAFEILAKGKDEEDRMAVKIAVVGDSP